MALPRSCGGYTDVMIAMLELKIIALPKPCRKRNTISPVPEVAMAHKREARVKIILPIKNIFFLPMISANLPKGTRNIADDNRNDIMTQFIDIAFSENSLLIFGKAMLTAVPIKGVKKDVTIVMARIIFLWVTGLSFIV
jgi:hypothetical protein